jgi:hypothetical protein
MPTDDLNTNTASESLNQQEENTPEITVSTGSLRDDPTLQTLNPYYDPEEITVATGEVYEDPGVVASAIASAGILGDTQTTPQMEGRVIQAEDENNIVEDWWSSFFHDMNVSELGASEGKQHEFRQKIDVLEEEKETILKDLFMSDEEKAERIKNIEIKIAEVKGNPNYIKALKDAATDRQDLKDWAMSQDFMEKKFIESQKEYSNVLDYLMYESSGEMGSSFSEFSNQVAPIAVELGVSLANLAASSIATAGSYGAATPWMLQAAGQTAVLASAIYFNYKGREHETYSEMNDAFEQRVGVLTEKKLGEIAKKEGRVRPLTESEARKVRLEAYDGLEQLKKQEMMLGAGDMLQTALMMLPWTRTLGKLAKSMSPFTKTIAGRVVGRTASGILGMGSEGAEEGSQAIMADHYVRGLYSDDASYEDLVKEFVNVNKQSYQYILTGETEEGFENDPEFRNAVRSGFILGGFMGGISNTSKNVQDIMQHRSISKETQAKMDARRTLHKISLDSLKKGEITEEEIEAAKALDRVELLSRYSKKDNGLNSYIEVLNNSRRTPGADAQTIDYEIAQAEKALKIKDEIESDFGFATKKTKDPQTNLPTTFKDALFKDILKKEAANDIGNKKLQDLIAVTNQIEAEIAKDSSTKNIGITKKIAQRDALKLYIDGLKKMMAKAPSKNAKKQLKEAEALYKKVKEDLNNDIKNYTEEGKTFSEEAFSTPGSPALTTSLLAEYVSELDKEEAYSELKKMHTYKGRVEFLDNLSKELAKQKKLDAEKVAEENKDQVTNAKSPSTSEPPSSFVTGVDENGVEFGFKKNEDNEWVAYRKFPDGSVDESTDFGGKDPNEVVAEAWSNTQEANKFEEQEAEIAKEQAEEYQGGQGQDMADIYAAKEQAENVGMPEDQPQGAGTSVDDLYLPSERKGEKKEEEKKEEGTPVEDLKFQSEKEGVKKKKEEKKPTEKPPLPSEERGDQEEGQEEEQEKEEPKLPSEERAEEESGDQYDASREIKDIKSLYEDFNAGQAAEEAKKRNSRKKDAPSGSTVINEENPSKTTTAEAKKDRLYRDDKVAPKGNTLATSKEMVASYNDEKTGQEKYKEDNPTIKNKDRRTGKVEFDFLPLIRPDGVVPGSKVVIKKGKEFGNLYVYQADANGKIINDTPITQIKESFNDRWSEETEAQENSSKIVQFFKENPDAEIVTEVADILNGSIVHTDQKTGGVNKSHAEKMSNIKDLQEQSPWFFWGGKPYFTAVTNEDTLKSGDPINDSKLESTAKSIEPGKTVLIVNSAKGTPIPTPVNNVAFDEKAIMTAFDNLRKIKDPDQQKRYFQNVIANLIYLDSNPSKGQKANINYEGGTIQYYINTAGEPKGEQVNQARFFQFLKDDKTVFRTNQNLMNTKATGFIDGLMGIGYDEKLVPIFKEGNSPMKLENYNDYLMNVATFTNIKPDFPLHNAQITLQPADHQAYMVKQPSTEASVVDNTEGISAADKPSEDLDDNSGEIADASKETEELDIEIQDPTLDRVEQDFRNTASEKEVAELDKIESDLQDYLSEYKLGRKPGAHARVMSAVQRKEKLLKDFARKKEALAASSKTEKQVKAWEKRKQELKDQVSPTSFVRVSVAGDSEQSRTKGEKRKGVVGEHFVQNHNEHGLGNYNPGGKGIAFLENNTGEGYGTFLTLQPSGHYFLSETLNGRLYRGDRKVGRVDVKGGYGRNQALLIGLDLGKNLKGIGKEDAQLLVDMFRKEVARLMSLHIPTVPSTSTTQKVVYEMTDDIIGTGNQAVADGLKKWWDQGIDAIIGRRINKLQDSPANKESVEKTNRKIAELEKFAQRKEIGFADWKHVVNTINKAKHGPGQVKATIDQFLALSKEDIIKASKISNTATKNREAAKKAPGSGSADVAGDAFAFKIADKSEYKTWNEETGKAWLQENLPNIPLKVLDNLYNVHKQGGLNAWGMFSDGIIYMAKNAEEGTEFHEAFHAVFDLYLSKAQKAKLLKETGIKNKVQAEEKLADDFRDYILSEGKKKHKSSAIRKFFENIYLWVKDKLGLLTTKELFKYIDSGGYSRRTPSGIKFGKKATKYKLAPGLTPAEQEQRVKSIAFDFLSNLKEEQGVTSIYDINEEAVTTNVIEGIFDDIKFSYKFQTNEVGWGNEVADQKAISILENFELLKQLAKQEIRTLGFKIKPQKLFTQEETELSDKAYEAYKEKVYDKPAFESSIRETLSKEIKMVLSTIPRGEKDIFDSETFYNFEEVYPVIARGMANAPDFEEMMYRLETIGESNPAVAKVHKMLAAAPTKTAHADANGQNGVTINNFRSKFFATFSNNYANFLTIERGEFSPEPRDSSLGRETLVSYKPMESNRRSNSKIIFNSWTEELAKTQLDTEKNKGITVEYQNLYNKHYKTKRKGEGFGEFAEGLSELLDRLGIKVEPKAIESFIKIEGNSANATMFGDKYGGVTQLFQAAEDPKRVILQPTEIQKEELKLSSTAMGEEKSLRKLALMQALITNDPTGDAFRRSSGNTVHPISMHNSVTQLIQDLKQEQKKNRETGKPTSNNIRAELLNTPGLQRNIILASIATNDTLDLFDFAYLGEEYDSSRKQGTEYKRSTNNQINRIKINAFLNGNKDTGWFGTPTMADKSTYGLVKMTKKFIPKAYELGSDEISADAIDAFITAAKDEFARIHDQLNKKIEEKDQIENYHYAKTPGDGLGHAYSFVTFHELNNLIDRETIQKESLEDAWAKIEDAARPIIKEKIELEIDRELASLEKSGVIVAQRDENGKVIGYPINRNKKNPYYKNAASFDRNSLDGYGAKNTIKEAIGHYVVGSYLFNTGFTNLAMGDLALFGSYEAKGKASKRAGSLATPGSGLHVGEGGARKHFNVAVIKDNTIERQDMTENYVKFLMADPSKGGMGLDKNHPLVKRVKKAYGEKGINQTDGQGYITLDRYREILLGQGQWTNTHQAEYNNLKAGKPTEGSVIFQPLKGIYSGTRTAKHGRTYDLIKYSTFPLIPAYTKGKPSLDKLRKKMENEGIDEVVFHSAYKVGASGIANSIEELTPIQLENKNWRIPQVVPVKQQDSANMGVQMTSLIFSNAVPGGFVEKKMVEGQKLLNRLVSIGFDKTMAVLRDNESIARVLRDQIGERELTELYEAVGEVDAEGEFRMPPSFPLVSRRVESIINSFIRKGITKSDIPGLQAVQVSSYGANFGEEKAKAFKEGKEKADAEFDAKKGQVGFDTDLKDVTLEQDADGNWSVSPAEVYISPEYFIKTVKKLVAKGNKDYDMSLLFDEEGNFKEEAVPEELRKIVLYRIPTQGKNSMMPVKIKGFLPKESGSSIIMPAFTTAIAGSDFDIDKVFVEIPNFNVVKERLQKVSYKGEISKLEKRQIQNALIDIHYDVLTSTEAAAELITPLDGQVLGKLLEDLVKSSDILGDFASPSYQSDVVTMNQAGKNLVGIMAVNNRLHAIAQRIGLTAPNLFLAGEVETEDRVALGQVYNKEDQGTISDNFNESLNAAVDNANTPLLGPLNINEFTVGVDTLLTHYGKFSGAKYLLNQPIIKELSNLYFSEITGTTKKRAIKEAVQTLSEKYGFELSEDFEKGYRHPEYINKKKGIKHPNAGQPILDVVKGYDLEAIEDNVNKTVEGDVETAKKALEVFLALNELSSDLTAMAIGLQGDAKGVGATMQSNLLKVQGYADGVIGNPSFNYDIEKMNSDSNKSYFEKGILEPTEEMERLFIWNTRGMRKVLSVVENKQKRKLNDEQLARLQYNFYTFLSTNRSKLGREAVARRKELFSTKSPKSYAVRVKAFKELEKVWEEKYGYKPSSFFSKLEIDRDVDGIDTVKFDNRASDALSKATVDKWTYEIEGLFNGASIPAEATEQERQATIRLMKDLAVYSHVAGGYNKGYDSFMDYIPVSIWTSWGVVDDHNELARHLADDAEISDGLVTAFFVQYAQNNPADDIIRRVKKPTAGTKQATLGYHFVQSTDYVVKDYDGNIYMFVHENPNGFNKYQKLETIGRGRALQEYKIGYLYTESEFPKPKRLSPAEALAARNKQFAEQHKASKPAETIEETPRVDPYDTLAGESINVPNTDPLAEQVPEYGTPLESDSMIQRLEELYGELAEIEERKQALENEVDPYSFILKNWQPITRDSAQKEQGGRARGSNSDIDKTLVNDKNGISVEEASEWYRSELMREDFDVDDQELRDIVIQVLQSGSLSNAKKEFTLDGTVTSIKREIKELEKEIAEVQKQEEYDRKKAALEKGNDLKFSSEQRAGKSKVKVTSEKYSRASLDNDPESMYLFTDNAERTSRPNADSPNITEGWYAEKYKGKTNKPLHYGSTSNPTSAVIRGKNNAYPISTMSAYGTNWTNDNFDLFKAVIDDEIAQIKKDLPKFKTLKIGDFRIGQGGRFAKLPAQHQTYLDSKLLEIGIDNSGTTPKTTQESTSGEQSQLFSTTEVTETPEGRPTSDLGDLYQQQKESNAAWESEDETRAKIDFMTKLFEDQGVEVEIELNADIEGNAQIVYRKGKKPLIQIKDASKDTVIHEFGHLYIDLLGDDHTLVKKAIDQLKGSKLEKETREKYPELSEKDLMKEVLATAIGLEGSEIYDSMKKANWWDRFVNLILDAVGRIIPGLGRPAAKELARRMLTGQEETMSMSNLKKALAIQKQVAQVNKDMGDKISRLEELKQEMQDVFIKKATIYKHKAESKEYSDSMMELAGKINKLDAKQSVLVFIANANSQLKSVKAKMDALLDSGEYTETDLHRLKTYASAYEMIKRLKPTLRKEKINLEEGEKVALREAIDNLEEIQNTYEEEAPALVAERLSKFTKQHTAEEIENFLRKVDGDITLAGAMSDFIGDSRDPVLALTAKMTDESIQEVRDAHMKFSKELEDKIKELEAMSSSKKDEDIYGFMLERDEKGNLTGHYVQKYKSGYQTELDKVVKETYAAITKAEDVKGNTVPAGVDSYGRVWEYRKENGTWFTYKSGKKVDVTTEADLVKQARNNEINKWHKENSIVNERGWSTGTPKDKWLNPQYNQINNSTQKEFLEWFDTAYQEMQAKLPPRHRKGSMLPVIRKTTSQRIFEASGIKGGAAIFGQHMKDMWMNRKDDLEKGMITDEAGKPLDGIPIFYTSENVEVGDRSFNIEELLSNFSMMANEFEAKSDLVETVEAVKDLVAIRKVVKVDSTGEKVKNFVKSLYNREVIAKEGDASAAMRMLDDYIKVIMYGQHDIDHGEIKGVNIQKVANNIKKYSSTLGMSFNWMANIANVNMGEAMNIAEGIAGEFFNMKDYTAAHWEWTKNVGGITADFYRRRPQNKISIVSQRIDLFGSYKNGIRQPKNTALKRAGGLNPATAPQELGEHMMQQSVMIAVMKNKKVTDKEGNAIEGIETLWDAIDTSKGYVEIDPRVDVDFNQVGRQINAMIRKMHGNYNSNTPIGLQRSALGKLALQFRKWVKPGFERRWGKAKYNEFLEAETRGAYLDFGNVMIGLSKDIARLKFEAASKSWENLSPREKANFKRSATEIGFYVSTLALMSLVGGDEDDEEDFFSLMFALQAKRFIAELTFYADPSSAREILKSPIPSISLFTDAQNLLMQAGGDSWSIMTGGEAERYVKGSRKGELKILKALGEFFPLGRSIRKLDPKVLEEHMRYMNRS